MPDLSVNEDPSAEMSTPSALSSPSTLMEKVRPEIRTKIFREAVRTEHRLVELGGIRVSSKIRERGTYTK